MHIIILIICIAYWSNSEIYNTVYCTVYYHQHSIIYILELQCQRVYHTLYTAWYRIVSSEARVAFITLYPPWYRIVSMVYWSSEATVEYITLYCICLSPAYQHGILKLSGQGGAYHTVNYIIISMVYWSSEATVEYISHRILYDI